MTLQSFDSDKRLKIKLDGTEEEVVISEDSELEIEVDEYEEIGEYSDSDGSGSTPCNLAFGRCCFLAFSCGIARS